MSFLNDALKFEVFNGKGILKALEKNPTRLLTGVDPASTKLWNAALGTDNKPLVDQMGGATSDTYKSAEAAGIDTGAGKSMQNLAHVVAAAYAANYGLGQLGAAGSGGGAAGGMQAGDVSAAGGGGDAVSGGTSSAGGSSPIDFVRQGIGNFGGFGPPRNLRTSRNEIRPYDDTLDQTLAKYNQNTGPYGDGNRIEIQGRNAYLYDSDGRVIGIAPADGRLAAAINSLET